MLRESKHEMILIYFLYAKSKNTLDEAPYPSQAPDFHKVLGEVLVWYYEEKGKLNTF